MDGTPPALCGLVLAAGAGARFGGPKALAREADGTPWVELAVRMLRASGCACVLVALGASAEEARGLVPPDADIVIVEDWPEGVSASLRAGLAVASARLAEAVLIAPVDTPDATAGAAARVISRAGTPLASALARAVYDGRPGHPVLIGRDHWAGVVESARGDQGARAYLATLDVVGVECGDLATGRDVDRGGAVSGP